MGTKKRTVSISGGPKDAIMYTPAGRSAAQKAADKDGLHYRLQIDPTQQTIAGGPKVPSLPDLDFDKMQDGRQIE